MGPINDTTQNEKTITGRNLLEARMDKFIEVTNSRCNVLEKLVPKQAEALKDHAAVSCGNLNDMATLL